MINSRTPELQNSKGAAPAFRLALVMLGASLGAASGCRSSDVASQVRPQFAWVAEAASIVPAEIQALARPLLARTERLIHSVTKAFPLRGQTVYRLVAFDEVTQATRKFAVDAAGAIVDFESLVKQEQATYRARYGVLDEALQARLLRSTATREAVEIRYRPTGHPPLRPASGALLSEAAHEAALNAFIGPNASTLAEEIIADGGRVISRNRYAPIIEAELPPALLLGKYKTHPLIEAIVRSVKGDPVVRGAEISTVDLNLRPAFHYNNYYGTGVMVGITGESGSDSQPSARCGIYFGNPWLVFSGEHHKVTPNTCTTSADCATVCASFGNPGSCAGGHCTIFHATAIAGMIGHTYNVISPRQAPAVQVFNVNEPFTVTPHQDALAWLFSHGVRVTSKSWGGPVNIYAQDYYSILGLTTVELAGNAADGYRGEDVMAGCHSANTLCIGAYTTTTSFWDTTNTKNRAICTKWTFGCDREEPHLTLHGANATTTHWDPADADGLVTGSGTSLATPAAAGLVALLQQRWPTPFLSWPEAVRATLMASATIDVLPVPEMPGKTYSDYLWPDERDGAGVPNAIRVESMMNNLRVRTHTINKTTSFDGNGEMLLMRVYLTAGQRLRSVISWDACPDATVVDPAANGTHADLDLRIRRVGTGEVIRDAASYDGSYEITEFVAPTADHYDLVLQRFGWNACGALPVDTTYLGFAYDVR